VIDIFSPPNWHLGIDQWLSAFWDWWYNLTSVQTSPWCSRQLDS
jgi:hypothetical protein